MKYTATALLLISILLSACKNNPVEKASDKTIAKDSVSKEQPFFPVPDYIGGQLRIIDSLKLPLSKTVITGSKTQLSAATDNELTELAQNFRQPDISDPAIKKFYTETSIADQSVPSVTFVYTTTRADLPVQKINLYVKPDPVENDKITGVYIEKMFSRNDTSFSQKLFWKTGKNMEVITEKQVNGKALPVEQIKITWDY